MSDFAAILARARQGEIVHLQGDHLLRPVVTVLTETLQAALGTTMSLDQAFPTLSWETYSAALQTMAAALDESQAHYLVFERALAAVRACESVLQIRFDKSLRAGLADAGASNYGYPAHRDSWFDLAPDGVNIVLYLTAVPYYGNTAFYLDFFGRDVPYDSASRVLLDSSALRRVTALTCQAGDCLVFSGEQLHSGAPVRVDRLSVEFRLSRMATGGRPDEGIIYRPFHETGDAAGMVFGTIPESP